MNRYPSSRGFENPGHPERKPNRYKFMSPDDMQRLLAAADRNHADPLWRRDHALLLMAWGYGLRAGEVVLLERSNFEMLEHNEAWLPTLKKWERVKTKCPKCHKDRRTTYRNIGTNITCTHCKKRFKVRKPKGWETPKSTDAPVKRIDLIEPSLKDYTIRYLAEVMSPGQRWLFERCKTHSAHRFFSERLGHNHIGSRTAQYIFAKYASEAGLSRYYSFHSLRHGRGVRVYEATKDLKAVMDALRHDSIATSEIYVHLSAKQRSKYLERLEQDYHAAANPET